MKRLLPFMGLALCALTACSQEEPIAYKPMTREWTSRHCVGYGDATEDRTLIYSPTPDGKFGLEICAQNKYGGKKEGTDYVGPVVLRVIDLSKQQVLAQESWNVLRAGKHALQASLQMPDMEMPNLEFTDGFRTFAWTASPVQAAEAESALVLNYPDCERTPYANADKTAGYLFEHCGNLVRLTAYPGGREVKFEQMSDADVGKPVWDDARKVVTFQAGGKTVEWALE